MTQAITAVGAADTSSALNGQVSKNDFLKLLVAQLSHQDPLAPQSDTAFVAQLAQFAQLEQAQNQTALLTQVQGQLSGQSGTQALGLVGQTVTARFESIQLAGGGAADPLQFTLDKDASAVTLTVRDSKGTAVRTLRTGALTSGAQAVRWDGRGDDGQPLPAGSYHVEMTAQNAKGEAVTVRPEVRGLVSAISYENGRPELLLGGDIRVQLRDVILVGK